MLKKPLISVVTVTYNVEETIERTIKSILEQKFSNFEYIIIDGKSSDKTVEIEEKYRERLAVLVSEPDKNLYDAMNKGTALAKGEWICYIQGDDQLATEDTLSKVAEFLEKTEADVVYGDAIMNLDYGVTGSRMGQPVSLMWKILPFSHQAMYVRTELAKQFPYDICYNLCADYDFCYKLYAKGKTFEYIPVTVAICSGGGRSDRQRIKGLKQVLEIKKKYDKNSMHIWLHKLHILKTGLRLRIRNLLPESFVASYFKKREQNKRGVQVIFLGPSEAGGIGQYIRNVLENDKKNLFTAIYTHYKKQQALANVWAFIVAIIRTKLAIIKAFFTQRKIILHIHMAVGGSFVRKMLLMIFFSTFVKGMVLHIHGAETKVYFEKLSKRNLGNKAIAFCMKTPSRIIFVSNYLRQEVFSLLDFKKIPYDKNKCEVLYNAISLPDKFTRPKVYSKGDVLQIATISRLEPQKNIFVLPIISKALAEKGIKNHFHIIGPGTLTSQFTETIKKENLESDFTLYGNVPNNEVDSILRECSIFTLASFAESFGIVVIEAYRNGMAVVTSNVGGLNDIVKDGETGYKCDPQKPEQFVEKIEYLVEHPDVLSRIQANVQKEVLRYGIEEHVKKLAAIYHEIVPEQEDWR